MSTLRETHPIKFRKIFKKSCLKVLLVLSMGTALTTLFYYVVESTSVQDDSSTLAVVAQEYSGEIITVWFAIILLLALYSPIYQFLYFKTYFYDIDDQNVIIRKGIISKKELTLPLTKITDVSVDQDLLDFALGLYDVHISTPTIESGRFAHVDGVDKEGAAALKRLILERIHAAN